MCVNQRSNYQPDCTVYRLVSCFLPSGSTTVLNSSVAQLNSGTICAAARAVRYGYPSIAGSNDYILSEQELKSGWPSTHKYWSDSVDYVVCLVDTQAKTWKAGQPVLLAGYGLSINYPPLEKKTIKGVKFVENERNPVPRHYYKLLSDGKTQQIMSKKALTPVDSDTGWLNRGYITGPCLTGSGRHRSWKSSTASCLL